ncbi:antibiotic biosynthesis monooxygenase [Mycobacterium sp.]|uniref:antibiotic biosynthesis monooxygenase n=1 Tax=Mycobacterium sp. TaxID=1785 RepID=UPI003BAD9C64
MSAATGVSLFYPVPDQAGFDRWVARLRACAQRANGFQAWRVSVRSDPQLDWGVAVTFGTEAQLHDWLDSPERVGVVEHGRSSGYASNASDVVIVDNEGPPPAVGVFRQRVSASEEADFVVAQAAIVAKCAAFSGFEGTALFPADASGLWMTVVRFRRPHQLVAWLRSPERAEVVPGVRALSADYSEVVSATGFGSMVRSKDGDTAITPYWKTAMLVLLVLYPTVMLLSRYLSPILTHRGAPPWLTLWLGQVVSVAVLQWLLMPLASRSFRRWLDPVDGAGWRISLLGAAVIMSIYVANLAVFATVRQLQYWHYL